MRIEEVHIKNLRAIKDEVIKFDPYTCFVGANGAGKSTVLCALNIFFRETENASTNLSQLELEDFHCKDPSSPIEITVTFSELSEEERIAFSAYYRQEKLIVTALAEYDHAASHAVVRQFGNRMAMAEFAAYFDAHKRGMKAPELKAIFSGLRTSYPELENGNSHDARVAALQAFENAHGELCTLLPSEDQFYGVNQTGKLRQYVQWIYIPAVKDASGEQAEARNTALGRLVARTVRAKVNFTDQLDQIREEAEAKYQILIESQQSTLDEVSQSLQERLAEWSTPDATARLNWHNDSRNAVKVEEPLAKLIAGDGQFEGNIARFGHGLQRSYLIALLQGLAGLDDREQPRLILGCEEPELYQHPPQARHLAGVLERLADGNCQVVLSTHSPIFVDGKGFESVRLVRKDPGTKCSKIRQMSLDGLSARLADALGEQPKAFDAVLIKLHQVLQPSLNEMFFTDRLVLVEGMEDQAYITAWLQLTGGWEAFRKGGCYIVPVGGKSELARPLAIALGLEIPVFTIFDADSDKLDHSNPNTARSRTTQHTRDNLSIFRLEDVATHEAFPVETYWGSNLVVWPHDLAASLRDEIGDEVWGELGSAASSAFHNEGGIQKNTLHIAERLIEAKRKNVALPSLDRLCASLLAFAAKHSQSSAGPAPEPPSLVQVSKNVP